MPHPPVIPTESRTTLSEVEGDVRLSGGIPTLCPMPCRIREFYQKQFHLPRQNASLLPGVFPLEMPSRIPRPVADPEQFSMRCTPTGFVFCGRNGAGEGPAPLPPRVSHPQVFDPTQQMKSSDWQKAKNPNCPAPEARREVSPP